MDEGMRRVERAGTIHGRPGAASGIRKKSTKTWLARARAWTSILLLAPVGVMAAFSVPHVEPGGWAELILETAGWVLFLAGAAFRWWATLFIGGRKGHALACQGPYSITRNPLYFGTFLMLISISACVQSASLAVVCVLVSVYYLQVTVPGEEGRLEKMHAEQYACYRTRVPRFFPRLKLLESPETIEVKSEGLRAEFQRTLRWALIPILCHAFVHARIQPWWPHWFNVP